MVDCTEAVEDITKLHDRINDHFWLQNQWGFLRPVEELSAANEQIRKQEGVLPVRESVPARNQCYIIHMNCLIKGKVSLVGALKE